LVNDMGRATHPAHTCPGRVGGDLDGPLTRAASVLTVRLWRDVGGARMIVTWDRSLRRTGW